MSLFENDEYQWRETYFVLLEEGRRPTAAELQRVIRSIGNRFEVQEVRSSDGGFELLTVISPQDFAGIDITYNSGEDVIVQVDELVRELARATLTLEERAKVQRLKGCTARFEVFHFEHTGAVGGGEEEDEILDPGGLLIVLEKLAEHYHGIAVDPQAGALL